MGTVVYDATKRGTDLWSEFLSSLVMFELHCTVVDRYCLADLEWIGRSSTCGLPWLVDQMATELPAGSARSLTVYTALPDGGDHNLLAEVSNDLWSRSRGIFHKGNFHFVHGQSFGQVEHRRWIRLNSQHSNRLVSIDHSLDRVGMSPIDPPITLSYSIPGAEALATCRTNEARLRRLAGQSGATLNFDHS
jgi:hypothetical protein